MRRLLGCLLVLIVFAIPAQAAAAPAPAWSIVAIPYPTNFAPGSISAATGAGPGYQIQATNIGGAPTSGTFTIKDNLPAPLTPSVTEGPSGTYGHVQTASKFGTLSCNAAGHTVTCTGSAPAVGPGEQITALIPVDVDPHAPGSVLNRATISGGGAAEAKTTTPTTISSTPAAFGFLEGAPGLFGSVTDENGATPTQAGFHPYQMTIAGMDLSTMPGDIGSALLDATGGGVRDIVAELPAGLVVDPGSTTVRCKEAELEAKPAGCPDASQVGTIGFTISLAAGLGKNPATQPLYNMVPPHGSAAELGFEVIEGTYIHLLGSVRSDGSYVLSAESNDILAKVAIAGVRPELWGIPSEESHDRQRGSCLVAPEAACPVERTEKPFVTLPSSCGGPLTTTVTVDSWLEPQAKVTGSYESTDLQGTPVGVTGCSQLGFEPKIESKATTSVTDSPAGLDFDLHQPQHELGSELSTANLRDATVTLPAGFVLNPSAGSGLEGCSAAQIGLVTPIGASPIRFKEEPPDCPKASKIGTVEVTTPVLKEDQPTGRLPHVLPGAVYLAKPFDNPFGTLLGIYLVVEDPQTGVLAKLPGRVEADQSSGQLTTSFRESPQLPLEDVKLHLFDGPRAALTTPISCGTGTTNSSLTPWSAPEGPSASPSASFDFTSAPGGRQCPGSEAQAPSAVGLDAGTTSPVAGSYSSFVLKLNRGDGTQRMTTVDTTLPAGLTGKLAGIPYCSDSEIGAAQGRSKANDGALEIAHPSCPQASEVGTADVAAGSGPNPLHVTGHAYLAGPYKGAPISLVVITPAVAGPFDLGVVVVRVALNVDPETAQIHAVSDPLPTILQGIPLDVRSVTLNLDRPSFTLNPTSCEPKQIEAAVGSPAGGTAKPVQRFQVENCARLAFKPKVALRLSGPTKRTGHPALKAVVTYPNHGAFANIARAQVSLPHSEFLDQSNIGKACTKPVLMARACPKKSIYGKAKAWTPLLEKPLEGPVYLVGGYGYKLPALVAELNGQIRVLLVGKVDTGKRKGIRNTFEAAPDAPVSRFVLEMKGGKKYGLLENSENICRKPQKAGVAMRAQNGRAKSFSVKIANSCGKHKKVKHGRRAKHHRRSKH